MDGQKTSRWSAMLLLAIACDRYRRNALDAYRKVSQSHCPVWSGHLSHLYVSDSSVVAADAAELSPVVNSHMCIVDIEVKAGIL